MPVPKLSLLSHRLLQRAFGGSQRGVVVVDVRDDGRGGGRGEEEGH